MIMSSVGFMFWEVGLLIPQITIKWAESQSSSELIQVVIFFVGNILNQFRLGDY